MTSPSSACLPPPRRIEDAPLEERGSSMSGYAKRVTGIVVGAAIVCVLLGLYIGLYLTSQPGSARAAQSPAGAQLYLGTVPASEGTDVHPTWVSYYAVDADRRNWRHDTTYVRPGQHGRDRHHLQLRRAERACATRSSPRPRGPSAAAFTLNGKPDEDRRPRRRVARLRHPATRRAGADPRGIADDAKNPCSQRAMRPGHRPHHHHRSRFQHGQAWAVSLAVLRPLCGRLHRGLGRTDADGRLHGRLRQGRMRRCER